MNTNCPPRSVPVTNPEWRTVKLKYLIRALEAGSSVNATDVAATDAQVGVLKTSCVSTGQFRASENKAVFEEELDRVSCPVRAGEIIISRMNTPRLVGASALVTKDYPNLYLPDRLWQTVSAFPVVCRNDYLVRLIQLQAFRDGVSLQAEGASASMQSLSREDFLNLNVSFPSVDTQARAVNLISREAARIDTLIDKQKKLIDLLKEKRRAAILP